MSSLPSLHLMAVYSIRVQLSHHWLRASTQLGGFLYSLETFKKEHLVRQTVIERMKWKLSPTVRFCHSRSVTSSWASLLTFPPQHNEGQKELWFAQIGTQLGFIASNPDDNVSGANPGSHIIKLMGTFNPTPITQKKNSCELPFVTVTVRTETRKPLRVSIHLRADISPPVQDCRLGMLTLTPKMS